MLGNNSGTFHSPNFPDVFPAPFCINYKVQVAQDRVIQLTWKKLDINSDTQSSPCMNEVQLYDQSIGPENEIFKACSSYKLPPQFTSSGNVVYVKFVTSQQPPFAKGFEASYISSKYQ